MFRSRQPGIGMGLLAGALGGAAGLLAMGGYWELVTTLTGSDPRKEAMEEAKSQGKDIPEESTTAKAGRIAYEQVTGDEPQGQTKTYLSYGVDWAYTIAFSAAYGVLRNLFPAVRVGFGTGMGTFLWLFGDEIGVWLMGLAAPPTRYPAKLHLHSAAAHWVYGATLEGIAAGIQATAGEE